MAYNWFSLGDGADHRLGRAEQGVMTKLTELFEQDLSELLGVPEDGARRWLEEARFLSEDQPKLGNWEAWLRDTEPAAYLRHSAVRDLMGLSVEDV